MTRFFAAIILFGAAACSRPAPGTPTEYAAPDHSFTARLPGGWKVDDAPGENRKAAFFGPPEGQKPFSELISVTSRPRPRSAGPTRRATF